MSGDPKPRPVSPLEKFPDHVRAIGMITIEMGILEAGFVHVLAAILQTSEAVGAAILFSPKSTRARLDIIDNVANELLPVPHATLVHNIVKRGLTMLGKRNEFVHEVWGVSRDRKQVMRIPPPYGEPKAVELSELTRTLEEIRDLSDEVQRVRCLLSDPQHRDKNLSD